MGLGVVAIADPPTAIRLKVPFSDGLGGLFYYKCHYLPSPHLLSKNKNERLTGFSLIDW